MGKSLIYHFFSDDDFLRITGKIKEMEKKTAGEIIVSIKEKRSFFNKKKSLRELTEEEFFRLNMQDTRDKTGILIYIILSEREFYILADSGINNKVSEDTWDNVRDKIQKEFQNGKFVEGVVLGVEKVGQKLSFNMAKARGGRIITVGTTTTRSLESAVDASGKIVATAGYSDLFIHPPFRFMMVDAMVTNFHLPGTTLLLLVSAFATGELIMKAYREAVRNEYRFFSYGDGMLIL